MRKVVLYIATSLDGYIAREDGNIDWLSMVEREGEDYGYDRFVQTVDTVIMGRKTYDKVRGLGIAFPHAGKKCIVLSRHRTGGDENVHYFNGDVRTLLEKIRQEEGKDIFCDGGAETVFELMQAGLIDTYIISILPVFLGSGISLFRNGRPEQLLKLVYSRSYPSGLVQICYEKQS